MTVVDALLAIGASDRARALAVVEVAAAREPRALLPTALMRHLRSRVRGDVYESADALTRFIDGGSNIALYTALHLVLRARHAQLATATLLDVGSGEGRVVSAVLGGGITSVDLVEPSAALLAAAQQHLADRDVEVRGHAVDAATFVAGLDPTARWDAAQSTFALHTMPAADRAVVLRALAAHAGRLLVAEFDVPAFVDGSRDHAEYAAERYELGLAEYRGDDVVVQGFLMPVLVGQFDPTTVRHTHEQSVAAWTTELQAAGFATVTATTLHPCWWADAVLLEATPV